MSFEQHLRIARWQCQTRFLSRSPKQKRVPCFLGNELWRIEVLDPSFRFHAASYDPFLYLDTLENWPEVTFSLIFSICYGFISSVASTSTARQQVGHPSVWRSKRNRTSRQFPRSNLIQRSTKTDIIMFPRKLHLDKTGGPFVSPAFHRLHTFIASSRLVLFAIKKQSTRHRRFRFVNWVNDTATVSVLNRNSLLLCVHLTIHENRIGNAVLTWHTC